MKKKNIFKQTIAIVILVLLICSLCVSADKTEINTENQKKISNDGKIGTLIWDNYMGYDTNHPSFYDDNDDMDWLCADDFVFETNSYIEEIHWIGAYWSEEEDGNFDWAIAILDDYNNKPNDVIYLTTFLNSQVHETFIEDHNLGWFFSYWVELPYSWYIPENQKRWISIWAIGNRPPWAGVGIHSNIIHGIEGVCKSVYWGYPEWTHFSEFGVHTPPYDMCFQLKGQGTEAEPDIVCHEISTNWQDVEPGESIHGSFQIANSIHGSMLEWEIISIPDWINEHGFLEPTEGVLPGGNIDDVDIYFSAPDEKNKGLTGKIIVVNVNNPSVFCEIDVNLKTPKTKEYTESPFIQTLLERFTNMFPILKQILKI